MGTAHRAKRIRVVIPVVTKGIRDLREFEGSVSPGTEITATQVERGPASIESEFDDALAAPETILRAVEGERDGADAVLIDCMDDPGLLAAREMVTIPVLGPCQTAMHLASLLGHRFGVVTVMEGSVPGFENRAKVYGVADKLASVRWVDIPVLELADQADRLTQDLIDESVRAVEVDGAHAIVFGCTGMLGYADSVRRGLEERGHDGIPVIDPIPATVRLAEALIDLGLRHSKRTYPEPPRKRIVGYGLAGRGGGAALETDVQHGPPIGVNAPGRPKPEGGSPMGTSSREVRIVTPVVGAPFPAAELAALGGTRFHITQVEIERGPASLESEFEESMSVPETLEKIVEADRDGAGAVVIDCMRDPGLGAARELVSTPVVGPAEATMHLASMLAHRFSVVTVLEKLVPAFENQAKVYGVADKLASVRSVEIPVLELERDPDGLLQALVSESVKGITEDGAHAIVFGCTGMFGYAKKVEYGLGRLGYGGVPVLDPIPTAVRLAQVLIDLGLTHSKRTYPPPSGAWAEHHALVDPLGARAPAT